MATVRGYRQWMARYATMRLLDVWYTQITDADIREAGEATGAPGSRSAPPAWLGSRPSSPRHAGATGCAPSSR